MLEEVSSLLTTAGRLADRVTDLCQRGEPVDNELDGLNRAVSAAVERLPGGVPPALHTEWRLLTDRIAAATAAAEARKAAMATQLEQTARHDRVRRAYVRPPT